MNAREAEGRFSSGLYDCFSWIPVGISLFCCAALLFGRLIAVSGDSMWPTLCNGDLMVASGFLYEPARGDIVVLSKPGFFDSRPIVKRVIAVGGDEIDIRFDAGEVRVNGQLLDEPYTAGPTTRSEGMGFPQVVPENCIFVMGDNRGYSDDSRDPALGMVDTRCVIGKIYAVLPAGQLLELAKGSRDNV